jgi:hypothetical protein
MKERLEGIELEFACAVARLRWLLIDLKLTRRKDP